MRRGNAWELPPPVIRSGVDDPIGLRRATGIVRRGPAAWRMEIVVLGTLGALLWFTSAGGGSELREAGIGTQPGPLVLTYLALTALACVPLISLSRTMSARRLARDVLGRGADRGSVIAPPRLVSAGEIGKGAIVVAELAFLAGVFTGHMTRGSTNAAPLVMAPTFAVHVAGYSRTGPATIEIRGSVTNTGGLAAAPGCAAQVVNAEGVNETTYFTFSSVAGGGMLQPHSTVSYSEQASVAVATSQVVRSVVVDCSVQQDLSDYPQF